MENINKVICQDCGIEYDKNQYYLSRIEGQEKMEVCKYCFEKEFISSESIEYIFRKYNIPFITELWEQINDKYQGSNVLPQYMKALWLPQFINLRWKDTDWNKEDSQEAEVNFYDGIVKNLKKEAVKLNDKLAKIRESLSSINSSQSYQSRSNDMNLYISTLKSLRETLDLISKYDWKLMYSEYEILVSNKDSDRGKLGNEVKQVSVWEQNHDNQIKNHKIWNVVESRISSTTIDNLIKLDLVKLGVKEIKCSERFYNALHDYPSANFSNNQLTYRKILVTMDKSIKNESNLIYQTRKKTYFIDITDDSIKEADLLTEKYPEMFRYRNNRLFIIT